jgi:hypothetical protein
MCVNIGQETRQLLFINLPMRRIAEILSEFEPGAEALNPVAISRMFMALSRLSGHFGRCGSRGRIHRTDGKRHS